MNRKLFEFGLLIFILFIKTTGYTQLNYGVSYKGGISNSYSNNHSYVYDDDGRIIKGQFETRDGNLYSYGSMFSVETTVSEKIKDTKIAFEQGLGIESKTFYSEPDKRYSTNAIKTKVTYNAIYIPLKVKCNFEKWLTFYGGVSNVLYIGNTVYSSSMSKKYNIRGIAGFDITLFKRYLFGFEYGHDITPYSEWKNVDFVFKYEVMNLKFGIVF